MVTDEQIAELMSEAIKAGDDKQVELCELALGVGIGAHVSDERSRKARAACVDVILEARAQ